MITGNVGDEYSPHVSDPDRSNQISNRKDHPSVLLWEGKLPGSDPSRVLFHYNTVLESYEKVIKSPATVSTAFILSAIYRVKTYLMSLWDASE